MRSCGSRVLGDTIFRIYDSLDGCELVGVLEPDDDAQACGDYPVCPSFSSLDELAEACEAISVVLSDRQACRGGFASD